MARALDEKKRRKILDSAFYCFGEKGFERTSVKQIAQIAGVASGSIYTYFRGKEELLCSSVEDGWNQFTATVQKKIKNNEGLKDHFFWFIDFGFDLLKKAYPLLIKMYLYEERRHVLKSTIEKSADYILHLITMNKTVINRKLPESQDEKRFLIKTVISGILNSIALTSPDRLDDVIQELKKGFKESFPDFSLKEVSA